MKEYLVVRIIAQAILQVVVIVVVIRRHASPIEIQRLVCPPFRDIENVSGLQQRLIHDHAVEVGMLVVVGDQNVSSEEFRLEVRLVACIGTPVIGGGYQTDELRAC